MYPCCTPAWCFYLVFEHERFFVPSNQSLDGTTMFNNNDWKSTYCPASSLEHMHCDYYNEDIYHHQRVSSPSCEQSSCSQGHPSLWATALVGTSPSCATAYGDTFSISAMQIYCDRDCTDKYGVGAGFLLSAYSGRTRQKGLGTFDLWSKQDIWILHVLSKQQNQ